jgi:hypothetical protein
LLGVTISTLFNDNNSNSNNGLMEPITRWIGATTNPWRMLVPGSVMQVTSWVLESWDIDIVMMKRGF